MYLSPQFDCRRMVTEYTTQLYEPAHAAFTTLRERHFEPAREKAIWNSRIGDVWDRVRIVETSPSPIGAVTSGKSIQVRAAVDLAGLKAKDVRVEAVLGRVGTNGNLEDTEVIVLPPTEEFEAVTVFAKEIAPRHTGRLGYALRVSPNHYEDPLTRPCPDLLRWS
jgi:starch phosphorylase